jgi:hypothetical protein
VLWRKLAAEAKHSLLRRALQARSTAFQTAGAVRPCELSLPDAVKQLDSGYLPKPDQVG